MTGVTPEVLLRAYAAGIFPMAESAEDNALYWVEPEARGILPLESFHVSRSLRKLIRQRRFEVRIDTAFDSVLEGCAAPAPRRSTTWINNRIRKLYGALHRQGHCHSIECWINGELVGGLYGVRLGAAFFGESMYSKVRNASKVALVHLVARLKAGKFQLLDAQFVNEHLLQFGAVEVDRQSYHDLLAVAVEGNADFSAFECDDDPEAVLATALR